MSEKEEFEIEEALQTLGFTKNDSKVLLTLCKYKILSPADIAKHSSVDRARVYDSLNRLIEKGFIQKEPIKRGANYQVIPVKKIFKTIRDEYKHKIEDTTKVEDSNTGESLIGVNILVEGTSTGTITAEDGSFSLV